MKKAVFVASLAGFVISTCALTARADMATTTGIQIPAYSASDDTCGVTKSDLGAIGTIQANASLGYLDELQQELAARKNLLSKTIACAEADIEQSKVGLENAPIDPSLEDLKNQWSDRLDEAISYYQLQSQKVNEVGISGTESIAKEILVWRRDTYAPLAENVLNFVTWSNNQALFRTAEGRLSQVDNLANSPLFSGSTDIQDDYEQAAVSLRAAEDQNTAAKNALSQSLPPNQSLSLIEQSLDTLSSTYQHFFDISNLVQSLLPH